MVRDAIGAIPSIEKRAGIPKIASVGTSPRGRSVPDIDIPLQPESIVQRPDPLEAAALQGVVGSLPERIIWKWLEIHNYNYQAQLAFEGGRMARGGQVLDFVVHGIGSRPIVLRVQGDYWHGVLGPRRSRDDEHAFRLRRRGYVVVDLWEGDIYQAVMSHNLTEWLMRMILG